MLRNKTGGRQGYQRHGSRATRFSPWLVLLAGVVVWLGYWFLHSGNIWHGSHETRDQQQHGAGSVWVQTAAPGRVNDMLLDMIITACMSQRDTWITTAPSADSTMLRVLQHDNPAEHQHLQGCPLLFIPLADSDRTIGLCTDAALYVNLLGAWIAPGAPAHHSFISHCSNKTAVMFLEPLPELWLQWLASNLHVVAVYAPNFEHVFGYDREAHMRMQLVLCKVQRCSQLMQHYLHDIGSNATLLHTGHTSLDPAALVRHSSAAAAPLQQPAALHVRGRSGLKHTKQLLDCWSMHPEWPQLTVLGPMPNEQVSSAEARHYMAAGNIVVPRPGTPTGPGWPLFDPLSSSALAALMLSHSLHVMPSEREGFGHSINEGRAAQALLVVPDHPPMNELVREGSGVLIKPEGNFSHEDPPVPALGRYGNISVSISPKGICTAVAAALALSPSDRARMGSQARQLFEADRQYFEQQVKQLEALMQQLISSSAARAT